MYWEPNKKRLFVDLSTRICAEDPGRLRGPRSWGGLLGGRVLSAIPRTPDHPVPSSLDVQTTREDRWGSQRNCTWILGLAGFRVVTTESDGEAVDSRVTIRIERRGSRGYGCSGCGRRTRRVRSAARSDVGRSALGFASGHADLCAASGAVSAVRHPHGSDRVRRREGPGDATPATTDRGGLSVDADIACGGPPWRQLGESQARRARVPARVGRPPSPPSSPAPGRGRDSPRQGAEVLHGAVGPRAR